MQSRTELELRNRISELERRLAAVEEKLGIDAPQAGSSERGFSGDGFEPSPQVLESLAAGRKIEAIKRYREETGTSLAEAKEAVERLEQGI